jgi:thioredoxin reductase
VSFRDEPVDAVTGSRGEGFVRTDPMTRETSIAGIYAAGDLTTRGQAAVLAAAAGMQAAAAINAELTADLVLAGALP